MASTLSPAAIHHLICILLERNSHHRWYPTRVLKSVNSKWNAVYKLYMNLDVPAPALSYLDSLELALVLKGEVDDEDVHAIFSHGKPLEFLGCPRFFVSKIVEVRKRRSKC